MSEEQQRSTGNRPTHRAYVVKDKAGSDKARWIEIGAAWLHKDGKGFRVRLDACPTNGEAVECRMIDWQKIDKGAEESHPDASADFLS